MKRSLTGILVTLVSLLPSTGVSAAPRQPSAIKVSGSLVGGAGYSVLLLSADGNIRTATAVAGGRFNFGAVPKSFLNGATLQLISSSGQYAGPIVLSHKKNATKGYLRLTGKIGKSFKALSLGKIDLKSGYGLVRTMSDPAAVNRRSATTTATSGAPIGAGKLGLVAAAAPSSVGIAAVSDSAGGDADGDGVPNGFDVDDNGNGNIDLSDPASASTTARNNPFTTLYLDLNNTLNANAGDVTTAEIDSVISGNGTFSLIIFSSLPPETASSVTGGHVVCDPELLYCRDAADGGSTAVYSGVSESDASLRNQQWSALNADGSGHPNMEAITFGGGGKAIVAGVQPRVGTSSFRPGDAFQVALTNGSTVVSTQPMSIAPYFVTVPALATYNAGASTVTVDYASTGQPGSSPGNPIVLTNGVLSLSFWRPQRLGIPGAETAPLRDMGHLHYGLIYGGNTGEFSCATYYSALSGLTESSSGSSGSLWTLDDNANDADPDPSRTLSFTVDLKSCFLAQGLSVGTYGVALTAAGEQLAGGANRAAQTIYVTIQ